MTGRGRSRGARPENVRVPAEFDQLGATCGRNPLDERCTPRGGVKVSDYGKCFHSRLAKSFGRETQPPSHPGAGKAHDQLAC